MKSSKSNFDQHTPIKMFVKPKNHEVLMKIYVDSELASRNSRMDMDHVGGSFDG